MLPTYDLMLGCVKLTPNLHVFSPQVVSLNFDSSQTFKVRGSLFLKDPKSRLFLSDFPALSPKFTFLPQTAIERTFIKVLERLRLISCDFGARFRDFTDSVMCI